MPRVRSALKGALKGKHHGPFMEIKEKKKSAPLCFSGLWPDPSESDILSGAANIPVPTTQFIHWSSGYRHEQSLIVAGRKPEKCRTDRPGRVDNR
jgi:hypothetical protein